MSKRAALYARVAYRGPGDEGSQLAGQMAACDEYARARGYAIVAAILEDPQVSSGLRLDRPGLMQLRAMVQVGELDVLVVHEIDRLARGLTQYLLLADELRQAGVRIECASGECNAMLESSLLQSLSDSAR